MSELGLDEPLSVETSSSVIINSTLFLNRTVISFFKIVESI